MNVFFRVDVGVAVGTGHAVRCRLVAQALVARGHTACFLVKAEEAGYFEHFAGAIPVLPLDDDETLAGQPLLERLLEVARPVLVTDTESPFYNDENFQKRVTETGLGLVRIAFRPLPFEYAHIVLNSNYLAPRHTYHCSRDTKLLLGLKYGLLNDSFSGMLQAGGRPPTPGSLRLLLTFGGADHKNLALRVYRLFKNTVPRIDIVAGPLCEQRAELEAACADDPGHRFVFNTNQMPEVMREANLAITSCGSTLWELCYMGVPRIAVSSSAREKITGEGVGADGLAAYAGHYDEPDLESRIQQQFRMLLANPERIRKQIALGQEQVDGRGLERFVNELETVFHG